jgi:hypothetical protein
VYQSQLDFTTAGVRGTANAERHPGRDARAAAALAGHLAATPVFVQRLSR